MFLFSTTISIPAHLVLASNSNTRFQLALLAFIQLLFFELLPNGQTRHGGSDNTQDACLVIAMWLVTYPSIQFEEGISEEVTGSYCKRPAECAVYLLR
jgi:hypothetical protein